MGIFWGLESNQTNIFVSWMDGLHWTYSERKAQQTRPLHKKPNLHWNGMEDPKDGGERSVIAFEYMPWNSTYIPPLSTINTNIKMNKTTQGYQLGSIELSLTENICVSYLTLT